MKERRGISQEEILKNFVHEYFASQEEYSKLEKTPAYKKAAIDTAVEIAKISDNKVEEEARNFDRSPNNDWPTSLIELRDISRRVVSKLGDKSEDKVQIVSNNLLRQAYAARTIEVKLSQLPSSSDQVEEQKGYDAAKELCVKAVVEFGCKKSSPGTKRDPIAKEYFGKISS